MEKRGRARESESKSRSKKRAEQEQEQEETLMFLRLAMNLPPWKRYGLNSRASWPKMRRAWRRKPMERIKRIDTPAISSKRTTRAKETEAVYT